MTILVDIIFSLAAILITLSYIFRDILLLRIIAIVGAFTYVIGGLIAGFDTPGMKALIFFSLVNLLVNLYQSVLLIIERLPVLLPAELKNIYRQCFSMMTTREFAQLYKWAKIQTTQSGEVLIRQDEPVSDIIIIQKGQVDIAKENKIITKLGPNFFIGEFSFLTHEKAKATVAVSSPELTYLIWRHDDLHRLESANTQLYIKLKKAIAINMIKKIDYQESHHQPVVEF